MNLLISGGVGKLKDKNMIPYYANLIPPRAKILYLPIAKENRPFSESYEKMCAKGNKVCGMNPVTIFNGKSKKIYSINESTDIE